MYGCQSTVVGLLKFVVRTFRTNNSEWQGLIAINVTESNRQFIVSNQPAAGTMWRRARLLLELAHKTEEERYI